MPLFDTHVERNEFFSKCKDGNLGFSMMVIDILLADEPIRCSDPDCRDVHTDWVFSKGTKFNGKDVNLRALWDSSRGQYVIMRHMEDL